MYKQAWRSYLASIHPRNLKKAKAKGKLFWVFYWMMLYPSIVIHDTEMRNVIWSSCFRFVPFFLLVWSSTNSPFLMSKAMFLVPVKEKERSGYVKAGLVIKTGISIVLGLTIEMILSIFYGVDILRLCVMVFIQFTLSISRHISFSDAKGKGKTSSQMGWPNILVILFGVLVIYASSLIDVGAEAVLTRICNVVIGITVAGYIVFDYLVIKNKLDATVALAGNYELTFQIEGKVEKPVKFSISSK